MDRPDKFYQEGAIQRKKKEGGQRGSQSEALVAKLKRKEEPVALEEYRKRKRS